MVSQLRPHHCGRTYLIHYLILSGAFVSLNTSPCVATDQTGGSRVLTAQERKTKRRNLVVPMFKRFWEALNNRDSKALIKTLAWPCTLVETGMPYGYATPIEYEQAMQVSREKAPSLLKPLPSPLQPLGITPSDVSVVMLDSGGDGMAYVRYKIHYPTVKVGASNRTAQSQDGLTVLRYWRWVGWHVIFSTILRDIYRP